MPASWQLRAAARPPAARSQACSQAVSGDVRSLASACSAMASSPGLQRPRLACMAHIHPCSQLPGGCRPSSANADTPHTRSCALQAPSSCCVLAAKPASQASLGAAPAAARPYSTLAASRGLMSGAAALAAASSCCCSPGSGAHFRAPRAMQMTARLWRLSPAAPPLDSRASTCDGGGAAGVWVLACAGHAGAGAWLVPTDGVDSSVVRRGGRLLQLRYKGPCCWRAADQVGGTQQRSRSSRRARPGAGRRPASPVGASGGPPAGRRLPAATWPALPP